MLFPEDDRRRYGRDPDPRDAAHLRDYLPGGDEHHVPPRSKSYWDDWAYGPLHPSVADRTWGEAADEMDGEA